MFGKEIALDLIETHMNRNTLFRKLEALTNMSPAEFIRSLRIKRAAKLLKEQYGNMSEVASEAGFSLPSCFIQVFKKVFSLTPAQFARSYYRRKSCQRSYSLS